MGLDRVPQAGVSIGDVKDRAADASLRACHGPSPAPILSQVNEGTFRFITVFDFNSRVARKNPEGTIEAFRRAFGRKDESVSLVIKTIHAEHHVQAFMDLRESIAGDNRIMIFDKAIAKHEIGNLISSADAYVSLHRAEGFGRPLVEAMMLKTAVVGTQWSGSADYLTDQTGYPVRSTLRQVKSDEYPFAAGHWAEPDLDHAAFQMVAVTQDPSRRKAKTSAAWCFVQAKYGKSAAGEALKTRLTELSQR